MMFMLDNMISKVTSVGSFMVLVLRAMFSWLKPVEGTVGNRMKMPTQVHGEFMFEYIREREEQLELEVKTLKAEVKRGKIEMARKDEEHKLYKKMWDNERKGIEEDLLQQEMEHVLEIERLEGKLQKSEEHRAREKKNYQREIYNLIRVADETANKLEKARESNKSLTYRMDKQAEVIERLSSALECEETTRKDLEVVNADLSAAIVVLREEGCQQNLKLTAYSDELCSQNDELAKLRAEVRRLKLTGPEERETVPIFVLVEVMQEFTVECANQLGRCVLKNEMETIVDELRKAEEKNNILELKDQLMKKVVRGFRKCHNELLDKIEGMETCVKDLHCHPQMPSFREAFAVKMKSHKSKRRVADIIMQIKERQKKMLN